MLKRILIFIIIIFNFLNAQDEYYFSQLKVENGLSQTTILSILQDRKGYMWFATGNGLDKYNGYTFTVYNNIPTDDRSISNNLITAMYEDRQGNLWAGTVDGTLNLYNRENDDFTRFNISNDVQIKNFYEDSYYEYPIVFSRNNISTITSISEDNKGHLWIGTWGKGVFLFNKLTHEKVNYYYRPEDKNSLSNNRISKILVDQENSIWIGTLGGGLNLAISDNSKDIKFKHYLPSGNKYSISGSRVMSLLEDKSGNLWVGTFDEGINFLAAAEKKLPVNQAKFLNHKSGYFNFISSLSIMSIMEDHENYIWIGTFGGGLNRYNPSTKENLIFKNKIFDENSLADNDVLSLYEDKSGIIWAGTHLGEGLSKLEKNKIKFKLLNEIFPEKLKYYEDVVWSILKDHNNNIWVGTYRNGIEEINIAKQNIKIYKTGKGSNSISDNHIRSFLEDRQGNIWAGTYKGGLNKIDIKTGKISKYINNPADKYSLGGNQIQSLYLDKNNILWLGSFGGGLNYTDLNKSTTKLKFEKFIHKDTDPYSLSDDRVYTIYEDRGGVLWIGTFGGGLEKFDRNKEIFYHYKNNPDDINSLSNDRVIAIHEDYKNNLWVGTYGGGLNKFDKKTGKFSRYFPFHQFASDVVYGILEDNNHNLWISTNNGVYKLNIDNDKIVHFDIKDGLQSREFSGGAYFKADDGEMFFGGIKGVNYFYPDKIKENKYIPNIVISSIKVFGTPIKGEKELLDLNYNQNFLIFEFAALDFSDPEDNQYMYKLEGLDKEWQKVSANFRMATYTNLAPGEYLFRVKGSNNDEQWNNEGAVIKIIIHAPYWKRWWFIALMSLFVISIVYYVVNARVKNILAIERLKSKLSADLHDNIGSGLTEISILSELVAATSERHEQLDTISEKARSLIDTMSDIVWVVNPKRDTLHDLIIRLKDQYSDLFQSLNISFKVTNLENVKNIKLPMEYKQNLYLILKEGINNSIKHSQAKRIILDVSQNENLLQIKLSDEGIGMERDKIAYGNGIKNMENRAKTIGTKLQIISSPGKGTAIIFTDKLGKVRSIKSYFNYKVHP